MSAAFLVATILTIGWNFLLLAIAFLTKTGPFHPSSATARSMTRARQIVRAEVGTPEYDARTEAWKRTSGGGTTEYVHSRVADTPQEVEMPTPYAEASVQVTTDAGEEEWRRCSVCMN
jgi:hypothetical protein